MNLIKISGNKFSTKIEFSMREKKTFFQNPDRLSVFLLFATQIGFQNAIDNETIWLNDYYVDDEKISISHSFDNRDESQA
jgi:hypothetical protein